MKKRVLMAATVPSMIGQFNTENIKILKEMGYEVDICADFTDTTAWPAERIKAFKDKMNDEGVRSFQIDFSREPLNIGRHKKSYTELTKLIKERDYAFIHTHTPIASAIVRIAAHRTHTRVIYTAHGFHFFDGAPKKNWIIFYPVEKILSGYTDTLVTITKEDYERAKNNFNAKNTVYIPGVGVDINKFKSGDRIKIRTELGIKDNEILILSVGELNTNKNHSSVIRAIEGIPNIVYVIAGNGDKKEELRALAEKLNVDLRLAGFRSDIKDFYAAADIYVLPSLREGLNVSLMEAMSAGLGAVCGKIRGNTDLIEDTNALFDPSDITEIKNAILYAIKNKTELSNKNLEHIKAFSREKVNEIMTKVYSDEG